jgi:pimeloyl-ACP methyl ester carboxylesterase
MALDERYRTAVLLAGGITNGEFRAEVDPLNFAPHIDRPVLMLNGRDDFIVPVEESQIRLFNLLGGEEAGNKYIAYEAEHSFAFRLPQQVRSATLDWWDLQLGKVE